MAVGYTPAAIAGAATVGGGILSAFVGLTTNGRRRNRWAVLAWVLLVVSFVVVVVAVAMDA